MLHSLFYCFLLVLSRLFLIEYSRHFSYVYCFFAPNYKSCVEVSLTSTVPYKLVLIFSLVVCCLVFGLGFHLLGAAECQWIVKSICWGASLAPLEKHTMILNLVVVSLSLTCSVKIT